MEKRFLFVGDLHGLDCLDLLEKNISTYEHIVLLGDYVDSFFISASEQLYNLNDLCNFVKENKNMITMLLGNHDYAYIHNIDSISGKQYKYSNNYKKIFLDNMDLFQIAWGHTNEDTGKYTLATHAGLTGDYYKKFIVPEMKENEKIHEVLNRFMNNKEILWQVGRSRGGRGIPGPLWADYLEVLDDRFEGINQVFGHTPLTKIAVNKIGEDIVACIDNWGNRQIVSTPLSL